MCACTTVAPEILPLPLPAEAEEIDPTAHPDSLLVTPGLAQCFPSDQVDTVSINMEIKKTGDYEGKLEQNKHFGPKNEFQQLNIKAGTQATFRLVFQADGYDIDTATMGPIIIKIWDMDAGRINHPTKGDKGVEFITVNAGDLADSYCGKHVEKITGQLAIGSWQMPSNSVTFKAKTKGTGADNVETSLPSPDPNTVDYIIGSDATGPFDELALATDADLQLDRMVSLTFNGKTDVEFTFSVPNGGGGRNIIFSVESSKIFHCEPVPPPAPPPASTEPLEDPPAVPPTAGQIPTTEENYQTCLSRYTRPIAENQKCKYAHEDRLWRLDGLSLELCRLKCLGRKDCNAFSYAKSGTYAKLCMGCKGVAGSAEHTGFRYYQPCKISGVKDVQCIKHVHHKCNPSAVLANGNGVAAASWVDCADACEDDAECKLFRWDSDDKVCDLCQEHADFRGAGAKSAVYGRDCEVEDH